MPTKKGDHWADEAGVVHLVTAVYENEYMDLVATIGCYDEKTWSSLAHGRSMTEVTEPVTCLGCIGAVEQHD